MPALFSTTTYAPIPYSGKFLWKAYYKRLSKAIIALNQVQLDRLT
jgi:hypothetical protein